MGIGGIESSVSQSSIRTAPKPVASSSTSSTESGVQSVAAASESFAKVAEPSQNSGAGNQNLNQNPQEQALEEGVPIQEVSKEKVESALKDINAKIRPTHTECQFSYHEKTKRISIKVLDQESGEVIREIPPEKTLDMIAKTLELAGILVDEKR